MLAKAMSEVGRVRKDNEDNYLVSLERGLFVVADGMGGHAGGEVASGIVKQVLDEDIVLSSATANYGEILSESLHKANDMILQQGQEPSYLGMGTTVTAAMMGVGKLHLAHIGDSRAYLFREGCLQLLTQDHSLVNELLQKGEITQEEAKVHPRRNVLTRALGIIKNPQIDLIDINVQPQDLVLLCTDGLYNQVVEEDIARILLGESLLEAKVEEMINLAMERGGNDNITAVLVLYE